MISSGVNLVMTVIGFSVSVMFIVFVCTRLICARIQLHASRRNRSFHFSSRSDLSSLERGLDGLEPVIIAKFPMKKFSEVLFAATEDALCSVCLGQYQTDDILRILPNCGHSFHVNCIDVWLQQHSTCPVCRISLREFSEKKSLMQPLFSSAIRPEYGSEEFNPYTCSCISSGRRLPSATHNRTNSVQENHCASVGSEAGTGEVPVPLTNANHDVKNLQSKQAESPSNP